MENLCVGHSVLPGDVLDTSETGQMEAVEPRLVPRVRRPGLAAVEKSAEHAGLVYTHLGVFSQLTVVPDSLP